MGKEKAGFLTPKAISNRIKAKGLQKLRWYCQMCQKQCRDENGFKCHLMSESHQRQLLLFAENPDEYIDSFSKDFLDGYLETLRRRCGTKRIHANVVYQDYINDREHIHMNSTQWETLTDFVKWMGREGHCVVDQTEKGWFVQYIDRDPEAIRRQEEAAKKEKMELDDEERTARFIQQQIEKAGSGGKAQEVEYTELKRDNDEEKISLSLGASFKKPDHPTTIAKSNPFSSLEKKVKPESSSSNGDSTSRSEREGKSDSRSEREGKSASAAGHKRSSALDEIMQMEEKSKEKKSRKDYWLHEGIVVKVITKKLGDKYHKKKAVVKHVFDKFGAVIKMLDSGDKIKVDQAHLETVIPAIGKPVLLVNGAYRGHEATVEKLNEEKFSCVVSLNSGPLKGRVLDVQYEDLSKLSRP